VRLTFAILYVVSIGGTADSGRSVGTSSNCTSVRVMAWMSALITGGNSWPVESASSPPGDSEAWGDHGDNIIPH